MAASGAWDDQLDYWRRELTDCPPPPLLPSDRRLGPHRSFAGCQIRRDLPQGFWRELGSACSREGVTRFAWIQTIFHLFIYLYTGALDFCTGTGFANRRNRDFRECWAWRSTRCLSVRVSRGLTHSAICFGEPTTPFDLPWIIRSWPLRPSSRISIRGGPEQQSFFQRVYRGL